MNEEKKMYSNLYGNEDYSVQELIQELMDDASWEPDPEYRQKAVGMLFQNVFPSC